MGQTLVGLNNAPGSARTVVGQPANARQVAVDLAANLSLLVSSAGNLLIALVNPGNRITDDFQRKLSRLAGVPGLFGLGIGRSGGQQGTPGFATDTVDHALDFHRRRLSAQGQCPHFVGNHCKSSP